MYLRKLLVVLKVRRKPRIEFRMSAFSNRPLCYRINHLLESYELSDCNFLVCGKSIKAHKLILGISSPVFEAMFYGPLSSNDDITITDVDPNIFKSLLKFIYTDNVKISSIEDAFDLMYASRKYMLENLTDICASYLISNLCIDNVITILNYPEHMQDKQVASAAINLFCQHAEYLFTNYRRNITSACVQQIVKSPEMNISEKDLIIHIFKWTTYYCKQNNIPITLKSRRDVIEKYGIFKYLRIYSLSLKDTEDIINSCENLLLSCEIEDIKKFDKSAVTTNHKLLGLLDKQIVSRKPLEVVWVDCFRAPIKSKPPIIIDQNNFIIDVKLVSNTSIFINSLNVPSRSNPVIDYFTPVRKVYNEEFHITIKAEMKLVTAMIFRGNVAYDSQIDIKLHTDIFLEKNCQYWITFKFPNTTSHIYPVQRRETSYISGNVKIFFEDVFTNDGGSFLKGLKYSL